MKAQITIGPFPVFLLENITLHPHDDLNRIEQAHSCKAKSEKPQQKICELKKKEKRNKNKIYNTKI